MYGKRHLVISFVVGVVTALTSVFVYGLLGDFQVSEDELGYVEVIHEAAPNGPNVDAVLERLDKNTGTRWDNKQYYIGLKSGPQSLPVHRRSLLEHVAVPDGEGLRLAAVLTNVLDAASVRANGRFLVIWFQVSPSTGDWLRTDPKIFMDPAAEDARETFWAGEFAIYYSAAGSEKDHGRAVEQWAKEITACSSHSNACELPPGLD